jgi:outer membrane protein OmpA-like peptidoglycan-associated protein
MKKITALLFILYSTYAYNQAYLGVHNSNYIGVMGTQIQPASFVDGRFAFDMNIASMNFNTYQNFGYFDANAMRDAQGNGGFWWAKSFDSVQSNIWPNPDSTFMDRFIGRRFDENSKKTLGFYNNVQVDLLNFAFHISPKIALGFFVRGRTVTNIDNLDTKLAVLAENGLDYQPLWNQKLNESLLNISHLAWSEYGFNYSQVAIDKGEHFLKVGGSIKYLAGLTAAYFYTSNFNYNIKNTDTSYVLQGDFNYGYSNNLDEITDPNTQIDGTNWQEFLKKSSSFGMGLDLGAVYEWRENYKDYKYDMDGETDLWMRNKNKYKLRVGASIIDLGGMKFQKGGLSRNFTVNSTNEFDLTTFESASSLLGFDQVIDSLIQQPNDDSWTAAQDTASTFWMKTPAALSFQVDYHIWKGFYVNASSMINLRANRKDTKVRIPNQFSITPSFDVAGFGLYLPISINTYSGFKAGIATRLGPLTLGVTDFSVLMAKGKVRGAEFYAGLRLPILYAKVKDKDLDKVSNKKDECPEVPGIWAFLGCPDTDGDGIQDSKDDCPTVAGIPEFNGCPDRDGDKIMDKKDSCPDVAGPIEYNGCPDTDGDKIIDKKDSCPTIAGVLYLQGCPDRDKDSITDADDLCPDNFGPRENNGCPDTDKDGIFDYLDDCPLIFGPKENNGCPWPDTDADGLLDKDDDCPLLAGPIENKGCPYKDTDGDGLLDKDDDCPNTPGPIANKGCPVIEVEEVEILKTAFDALEFAFGKDIILDVSKPSLIELAGVLKKKPTWKLEITGHTDDVGDDQANLVLSKKRAEAIRKFLSQEGIEPTRLIVLFFGEMKPIADNTTKEGRQKNRRVEMKIVFD